jgi:hypothetical protein
MPRVSFVDQSASDDDSIASNPARLLNLYPSPTADAANSRTAYLLKSVLGQDAQDSIGAAVRAMGRANGKNWLVGGGKLYEVLGNGQTIERGTVADDANTTIAGNGSLVTVVAGNNYYRWNGTNIAQPTTKTFTNVGSHCYVGSYTVITEKDGKRFQWSAVGNADSLNALHFASADKVDDNILRAVEFRGNLLLFCTTSTEIWSIAPDADATARFQYADITNTGLKAFNLLVRFDDALFFIGTDERAYIFGQGVVSNTAVETSIAQSTPTHCFYYEDEGHKFAVIRFSDRPAWVYDLTTGLWHERSETAGHGPWRATCSVRNTDTIVPSDFGADFGTDFGSEPANFAWLVGNTAGDVLAMARTNRDLAAPLHRRAIARSIYLGDRKFSIAKLELVGRMGDHLVNEAEEFVLALGPGEVLDLGGDDVLLIGSVPVGERDASVDLYESLDGGRTWRGPKSRSMGRQTDYQKRMTWHQRGQAQQYTARFDLSDPADLTLYADGFVTAL